MNPLIQAKLVYDGSGDVRIPSDMGGPAPGQMEGTARDRLVELAGRVCYDSLGRGRNSADYHKHIQEVGHLSVLEHAVATVVLPFGTDHASPAFFLNRPGVHVVAGQRRYIVTTNPRAVIEWFSPHVASNHGHAIYSALAHQALVHVFSRLCPQVVRVEPPMKIGKRPWFGNDEPHEVLPSHLMDDQAWVSLFMSMSRGCSHELVRHGDWTAISQRSTRFVNESESPWVDHPLVLQYLESGAQDAVTIRAHLDAGVYGAKSSYAEMVEALEPWLVSKGVDKTTARKQARGAARGYLGNALYTEMIFSASVAQWKHMLRLRGSVHADSEIRELFVKALAELKNSVHEPYFRGFITQPSPDGIGEIVVESEEAAKRIPVVNG